MSICLFPSKFKKLKYVILLQCYNKRMNKIILIIITLLIFAVTVFYYRNDLSTLSQKYLKKNMKSISTNSNSSFPELSNSEYKTVKFGESVYISETTKIKFLDVISDNRCPVDVNCIVRGEAKIKLQLTDDVTDFSKAYISVVSIPGANRDSNGNLIESHITEQNQMPYMNLMTTILDLLPRPNSKYQINKSDYQVLLKVEQLNLGK